MSDRKTIALFISGIAYSSQQIVCKAVAEYAARKGFYTEIYVIYGSFGSNVLTAEGEAHVVNLPDFTSFSGIITMLDVLDIPHLEENLWKRFQQAHCPVVCLRGNGSPFHDVLLENQHSTETMVEHFLQEGITRICYLAGKEGMEDSIAREQGFVKRMQQAGQQVGRHQVFHGNFWYSCAEEALDTFYSKPGWAPEAIICANDFMAIGVINALQKRGIQVPEEVQVTGFDDIVECQIVNPSLTTLKVPFDEMARTAVDMVAEELEGKNVEHTRYISCKPVYRGSTGTPDDLELQNCVRIMNQRLARMETIQSQNLYLSLEYEETVEEENLFRVFAKYADNVEHFKRMYVCLCDEEERQYEEVAMYDQYTEHMILRCKVAPHGVYTMSEERFERKEILPKKYVRDDDYSAIVQIHFKNHVLGYLVVTYDGYYMFDEFMQQWLLHLAEMLESLDQVRKIQAADELRRAALYDALTGIYNRRGFEQAGREFLRRAIAEELPLCLMTIDMDGLKTINDTYGHQEGDWALKHLAESLQVALGEGEICSRHGGDEFAVCALNHSEAEIEALIFRFRQELADLNATSGKPYQVEASIGYHQGVPQHNADYIRYLYQSDAKMYEEKRSRKQGNIR